MTRSALQRRHDVLLVAHGRDHHHARFRIFLYDFFRRLNAFHLRHGDVHEHDVGLQAVIFADGGETVSGFARHLPAKTLDDAAQVLASEYGVVDDQVLHRLTILAPLNCSKLLHIPSSASLHSVRQWLPEIENLVVAGARRLIHPALCLQSGRDRLQFHHAHGVPVLNGSFGHAKHHAGLLSLRDGEPAGGLYQAESLRAILPHPGHQHTDATRPEFLGQALEHDIARGPVTVYPRVVTENRDVPERQPLHL